MELFIPASGDMLFIYIEHDIIFCIFTALRLLWEIEDVIYICTSTSSEDLSLVFRSRASLMWIFGADDNIDISW